MLKMREVVFEFKRKYYLAALAQRGFNFLKTAKELKTSRTDIFNHVGRSREDAIKLAKEYEII
jgi:DNA-binding NtrC family response regulator